jgi:hypothetical protein
LVKIAGVSEIETDTTATTAKFKVGKEVKDLQAQLDEFAKTNTKLAGYSFVEGKPKDNN